MTRCGRGKFDLGKMACERQKISWYRNSKHHLLSVEFLQKLMIGIDDEIRQGTLSFLDERLFENVVGFENSYLQ